jgi:hypothetical protein
MENNSGGNTQVYNTYSNLKRKVWHIKRCIKVEGMKMTEKVQTYSTFLPQTAGDFRKLLLWYAKHRTEAFYISLQVPSHKLSFKRLEVTDETRQQTKRWKTLMELLLSTSRPHTKFDNKVCELATTCLPWQQWTETSVWFDDIGISAFHSCVVTDLWQSLSKW